MSFFDFLTFIKNKFSRPKGPKWPALENLFFYKRKKIKKGHFSRVKNGRKTRFFDPKLWVSTKKRDILTFLGL